ncbi:MULTISPECIES: sensor histidine kinase [Niallia]|uniref:histidine kinase n=1 Tax=Niallia circulans TaxID=1397 RepID=A0AA91TWG1_NIACI|nr:sensor histidine kinase [Niallia circulans]AYV70668.1 sensor histidine kinase [Niallia circulans]NRG29234.1 sensor histidine kinase [Niallia circulans]PAD84822.1 sensor histidine kinase [Niallia circulans]QJX62399.1 sensor histidine kinase [Niallia circulans]
MLQLLPLMIERVGILVIFAFLLSRIKIFRSIIHHESQWHDKLSLILIFGVFGIISNYTGVEILKGSISTHTWQHELDVSSAIANTRIMGVAIGGMIGGPLVGLGVGLIAGLHRLTLGGFTALACGLSTIAAGLLTGLLGRKYSIKQDSASKAVIIGITMEIIQMLFILLIAAPFELAFELVKIIAFPMIVINGFGMLIFIYIIQNILLEEEKTKAAQTNIALNIAQSTLAYFRQGLNPESSKQVAKIMLKATNADAVSITNRSIVLAHEGLGGDHHIPLEKTSTKLTEKVLREGNILIAKKKDEIQCSNQACPLHAAILLPLKANNKTVGTLKLYFANPKNIQLVEYTLAEGLSKLFSLQLELAEAELQQKLWKDAEIKALQAQVHPHFLFNSMNTISALIRTDGEKARQMIQRLSTYFRSNIQGAKNMLIPLSQELEHVHAFLALEEARFPNKFIIKESIEPELKKVLIPPFTLQPLVENSIRHGFSKGTVGTITICAYREKDRMVLITEDDGKGMSEDTLYMIGQKNISSSTGTGTALWNIQERVKKLYAEKGKFTIESEWNRGTKVMITLPSKEPSIWREVDD